MTDTDPRDLIKLLIDALKQECNWIDNPKHDELIAKATAYLTQYAPEVLADEGLNSKSSPNNLQIRSSDIVPPPDLIRQWMEKTEYDEDTWFYESYIAEQAAQWGADRELEACIDWISVWHGLEHPELLIELLRAARRPKPQSLNSIALQMLGTIEKMDVVIPEITDTIRRALEQLPDTP